MSRKIPKVVRYAAIGLLLSPLVAGTAKGKSLDDVVNKAAAGRSVRVTVQDDFNKLPLADAWVRFVNQNNSAIAYSDSTDPDGVVQLNDVYTDVEKDKTDVPKGFILKQNCPNPFNPSTTIPVSIDHYCDVDLGIYNILGQPVKKIYSGKLNPGEHEYRWDGTNEQGTGVAAGQYIVVFRSKDDKKTIKMMLIDGNVSVSGGGLPKLNKTAMVAGEWYDVHVSKTNYGDLNLQEFIEDGEGVLNFSYEMTRNNQPPVPVATVTPLQAKVGETVTLDDTGSYDPENDPFTYYWETEGVHYTTPDAQHTYSTPGEKTVTVTFTLTDERGAASDTSYTVTVSQLEKIALGLVQSLKDSSNVEGSVVQVGTKSDTTNADGSYSIAGLEPGNYRMTVTTPGRFLTHSRDVSIADADTNNISIDWLFPSDTTSTNWRNGTVFQRGYSVRWDKVKGTIYVDKQTVPQNVQDMIVTCATDPNLNATTGGFITYTPDSINFVNTSERPASGTEGTIVIKKPSTGGNSFGIWEYVLGEGRIKAGVVNLTTTATMPIVAAEWWGSCTGIGDFNQYASVSAVQNKSKTDLG